MARFPKVPSGSQSPFERRLRMKAEEVKPQRELRGCGDPNCSMCNPKDREGSPMASSAPEEFLMKIIRDEAERKFMYALPNSSADTAYSTARKAVEEFIITVPPEVSWGDVIGNDEAKQALLEAIEAPTVHADLYSFYNMSAPRGCLLWGPPGCGKTMFAKAAAGALARLHGSATEMLLINGPALQSMWVGETEKQIRAFFEYARAYRTKHSHPLVIFIDEADAILPSRSEGSARFEISNVSTFLAEMDGLKDNAAYIILATNRPEVIDEALLRDGRVSHKVKVERPSFSAGREIVQNALLRAPLDEGWEIGEGLIARDIMDYLVHPDHKVGELTATNGEEVHILPITLAHIMSGAMLVGLVARAKAIAFRRDLASGTRTGIQWIDLTAAVDQLVRENTGLHHSFAAEEIVESFLTSRREEQKRMMN